MKRTIVVLAVSLAALGGLQMAAVARSRQARHAPAPSPVLRADFPAKVAAPVVRPIAQNPDPQHRTGDLIEISIASQRLTAWRNGSVVMRLVISTGAPGYDTPTGHYHVIAKYPKAWSAKWGVWMPWGMNWHGNYFIHQLPHFPGSSVNIGASELGRPASHGCVRTNVGDAERLYAWTAVGTPVWVR